FTDKYARFLEQAERTVVERVIHVVDHFANAGVDDHLRALKTRCESGVDDSVFQRDAMVGSLDDGVLFPMRAQALIQSCSGCRQIVASGATTFVAVARAAGCAVVSRRYDALVPDDNRRNFPLHAIRSGCRNLCDTHEVFVPTWPLEFLQ